MNKKYKQNFLIAGKMASEVRAYGKSLIKKGASYNDVIQKICAKIKELGAIPAFPPQIALDDVAAHYLPEPTDDIIFDNQLVKLDVGVCYQGAVGDCATSIDLSGQYQHIVDAAELALLNAEKTIKVGIKIADIGKIIEESIKSFGLSPIRNLCGHGLGQYIIHTSPSFPNYNDHSNGVIKPGMTFAIEPFATNGKGLIYEKGFSTIYSFRSTRPVKSDAAKLLIRKIKSFNNLPFSIHNLQSPEIPYPVLKEAIYELLFYGVISGYPPLLEEAKGMVAQAENSFLVDENGEVFVTTKSGKN